VEDLAWYSFSMKTSPRVCGKGKGAEAVETRKEAGKEEEKKKIDSKKERKKTTKHGIKKNVQAE